jgi:hypothetical protein
VLARGPETRKIPTPPRPIGVAWATIVSFIVVPLVESGRFGKRFCEFDRLVVEE